MRKLLALLFALIPAAALAGGVPLIPSNPNFNEPSQIVGTLNQLIQSLNGQTNAITPTQPIVIGVGAHCTNGTAGASPQICNGSNGAVLFTSITVAATGTNQTIVVTNSAVTANSTCFAQWNTAFTAGSAVVVGPVTPSAGSMSIVIANAGATTNAVTTGTLGFTCVN